MGLVRPIVPLHTNLGGGGGEREAGRGRRGEGGGEGEAGSKGRGIERHTGHQRASPKSSRYIAREFVWQKQQKGRYKDIGMERTNRHTGQSIKTYKYDTAVIV